MIVQEILGALLWGNLPLVGPFAQNRARLNHDINREVGRAGCLVNPLVC